MSEIDEIIKELDLKNKSYEELLNLLETVSPKEINNIKAVSVIPLPTVVKDREADLKGRMVNIVADKKRGMSRVLDIRLAILKELENKIGQGEYPAFDTKIDKNGVVTYIPSLDGRKGFKTEDGKNLINISGIDTSIGDGNIGGKTGIYGKDVLLNGQTVTLRGSTFSNINMKKSDGTTSRILNEEDKDEINALKLDKNGIETYIGDGAGTGDVGLYFDKNKLGGYSNNVNIVKLRFGDMEFGDNKQTIIKGNTISLNTKDNSKPKVNNVDIALMPDVKAVDKKVDSTQGELNQTKNDLDQVRNDLTIETARSKEQDRITNVRIDDEAKIRRKNDIKLGEAIQAIVSKSDVADVVASYAELEAYNVDNIFVNDVIKVLRDESPQGKNAESYYRLINKDPVEWRFIGSVGESYTKAEQDIRDNAQDLEILANRGAIKTVSERVANVKANTGQYTKTLEDLEVRGVGYGIPQLALTISDEFKPDALIARSMTIKYKTGKVLETFKLTPIDKTDPIIQDIYDTKADINGSYIGLQAGSALQLINTKGNPIDKAEFISRETYGGAAFTTGPAKLLSIEGNTEKSKNIVKFKEVQNPNVNAVIDKEKNAIKVNGTIDKDVYVIINQSFPKGNYVIQFGNNKIDDKIVLGCNLDGNGYNYNFNSVNRVVKISNKTLEFTRIEIKTGTYDNVEIKFMVSEGTTEIPFEPHYEGLRSAMPKRLLSGNENLWDEKWQKGGYALDGDDRPSYNEVRSVNFIKIIPNKKMFNGCKKTLTFIYYDINRNYIKGEYIGAFNSIQIPNNAYFLKFSTVGDYGTIYKNDIMINYGTHPLPYVPHEENTLNTNVEKYFPNGMNGEDNWRDEYTPDQAKQNASNKLVLNGSESGWYQDSNSFGIFFANNRILRDNPSLSTSNTVNNLSTWKDTTADKVFRNEEEGISVVLNLIQICKKSYSNLPDFLKWLGENPITLTYALENPVITPIDPPLNWTYQAYGNGSETWYQDVDIITDVSIKSDIEYASDMAGKLSALRTAPEQENIDTEQDRRIKALEDRIVQLETLIPQSSEEVIVDVTPEEIKE